MTTTIEVIVPDYDDFDDHDDHGDDDGDDHSGRDGGGDDDDGDDDDSGPRWRGLASRSASGSPRRSRCWCSRAWSCAGVVVYTIESQRLEEQIDRRDRAGVRRARRARRTGRTRNAEPFAQRRGDDPAVHAAQRPGRERAADRLVGRRRRAQSPSGTTVSQSTWLADVVAPAHRRQRHHHARHASSASSQVERPERRAGRPHRGAGGRDVPRPGARRACTTRCGPTRSSPRSPLLMVTAVRRVGVRAAARAAAHAARDRRRHHRDRPVPAAARSPATTTSPR